MAQLVRAVDAIQKDIGTLKERVGRLEEGQGRLEEGQKQLEKRVVNVEKHLVSIDNEIRGRRLERWAAHAGRDWFKRYLTGLYPGLRLQRKMYTDTPAKGAQSLYVFQRASIRRVE